MTVPDTVMHAIVITGYLGQLLCNKLERWMTLGLVSSGGLRVGLFVAYP